MFSSLNNCRTFNKTRKDDFESLLYILLYLTNKFRLPWEDLKLGKSQEQFTKSLQQRVSTEMITKTLKAMPQRFRNHLKDCYSLKFEDTPDYESFRQELKLAISEISSAQQNFQEQPVPFRTPDSSVKTILNLGNSNENIQISIRSGGSCPSFTLLSSGGENSENFSISSQQASNVTDQETPKSLNQKIQKIN